MYLHPAESEEGLEDIKAITSGMLQFRIIGPGPGPRHTGAGANRIHPHGHQRRRQGRVGVGGPLATWAKAEQAGFFTLPSMLRWAGQPIC